MVVELTSVDPQTLPDIDPFAPHDSFHDHNAFTVLPLLQDDIIWNSLNRCRKECWSLCGLWQWVFLCVVLGAIRYQHDPPRVVLTQAELRTANEKKDPSLYKHGLDEESFCQT